MFELEKHYEQYSNDIYKFIYFLTFNKQIAEDLMQETFIKAFEARTPFRNEAQISTWLHAIAKNCTYDYLKKKSNRLFLPFGIMPEPEAVQLSAEEIAHLEEDRKALYIALSQLKYDFRAAIILRKLEQKSIKETAVILNWNESKVKNCTERGMQQLKRILRGEI